MNQTQYQFKKAVGKCRDEAKVLHYQRYKEVGFLNEMAEDQYEKDSVYFVAQSEDTKKVVGVIRLIFRESNMLPTIENFEVYEFEKTRLSHLKKNRYAEVSAFTKIPQHDVGLGLIKSIVQYSLHNGISHWICCIDERVFKYMDRMFKFPFRVIGPSKVYMGSVTIPCVLDLKEADQVLQEKRPAVYHYLTTQEDNFMEVLR